MFELFIVCAVHSSLVIIYLFMYLFISKCTNILEVSLFAYAYRLFHEDFSSIDGALHDTQPFSSFIYINLVGFLDGYS